MTNTPKFNFDRAALKRDMGAASAGLNQIGAQLGALANARRALDAVLDLHKPIDHGGPGAWSCSHCCRGRSCPHPGRYGHVGLTPDTCCPTRAAITEAGA